MSDNVNIIVQDTINEIVVNSAVTVETIDINVQVAVDEVNIIANPNNYLININRIIGEQVQSDWDQNDDQAPDYIKNKPIIPAPVTKTSDLTNDGEDGVNPFITANDVTPQVNSDWNATSGVAQILNKPTIPAAQVNSDWNATSGVAEIFNKPTSLPPNGVASGDLQGNYPNPTVHRVHGVDFQSGAPAIDDTWVYVSTPFGQQPFQWQHSKLKTSQVQNDSTVTGTNADDALEHLDSSKVATTRTISTTTPLQGGGDLSANRTLSILQSNTTQSGFLSNTDWNTFNGKFNLPSLTSGSVLFSNGTTIAQDNANFFWDDTNNRLGIKRTNPLVEIDVIGSIRASSTVYTDVCQFNFLQTSGSNLLIRGSGGTSRITMFQATGNLLLQDGGIFTDSGFKLDVNGTTRLNGNTLIGSGTATPSQKLEVVGNVIVNNLAPFIDLYSTQTGTPSWKIYNSYNVVGDFSIVGGTSVSNKFNIQPNGNVGIGTTSPQSKLQINAQGALSTDIALKVRNSADTADFIAVNGLGNVGVGTTASTEKLTVWNDTAASIGIHTNREIAGDLAILRFSTVTNGDADLRKKGAIFFKANGTGNGRGDLQFAVNNAADSSNAGVANAVMTLQADGNVGIGISTPAASAKLDITSTTQGFLPPRMTTVQRNAIASPATGLIVYDTTLLSEFQYNGTAWVTYQSQLNGTGFVKASGTTISYDNNTYAPIIAKDFVNDGVSGTTVNTIIRSYLIPSNTFVLNDSLDILCSVIKNTTLNNVNIRVYFNTTVSLTGATLVGTYALTSTTKFINFQRTNIFTGSSFYCFPPTVSSITDRSVTNIDASVVPFNNLVNNYIIFAIQLSNSLDGGYIGGIRITK